MSMKRSKVEIVLCATQRCGSTMVVEDMRNTEVLGNPEEWFIPWVEDKPNRDYDQELESIRRRATGKNGVLSIKIMANQIFSINSRMSKGKVEGESRPFSFFHSEFQDANWVWIQRRDIVAQAVSREIARQTGINHATRGEEHFAGRLLAGYKDSYNESVQYQYGRILGECLSITLENLTWRRFFSDFHIEPLTIFYEDICLDESMRYLDSIAARSDIEIQGAKKSRKLVRLSNSKNQDLINQFYADMSARNFNISV